MIKHGVRSYYGALESNGLVNGQEYHADYTKARTVDWTEKNLRITRLRLLSDPGFPAWDVSYCHGVLPTGEKVVVQLPFDQLPKKKYHAAIVAYAKQDRVYAHGLKIFDAISTLN